VIIPAKITISKADRVAWVAGRLHESMAARYPEVIDADDLRLARNQYRYGSHYTEWAAGVWLWRRLGLRSLLEKYEFAGHPRKAAVLASLGVAIVRNPHCQHPDLLVYDQSGNWEFVEVKTTLDALSDRQKAGFPEIEKQHGKKIKILKVIEA
jgi:hypothetical protein